MKKSDLHDKVKILSHTMIFHFFKEKKVIVSDMPIDHFFFFPSMGKKLKVIDV